MINSTSPLTAAPEVLDKSFLDRAKATLHKINRKYDQFMETPVMRVRWQIYTLLAVIGATIRSTTEGKVQDIAGEFSKIGVINLASSLSIGFDIYNTLKQWETAKKASDIAKNILGTLSLMKSMIAIPGTIIETVALFGDGIKQVTNFSSWIPGVNVALTILSVAGLALKAQDLRETYRFVDKRKQRCAIEVVKELTQSTDEDIKTLHLKFSEELKGVGSSLAAAEDREFLKKLKSELNEEKPDPAKLKSLRRHLPSKSKLPPQFTTDLEDLIQNIEANTVIKGADFLTDFKDELARQLQFTKTEANAFDFIALKKELKKALRSAEQTNPRLLEHFKRTTMMAYLKDISERKVSEISQHYQLEAGDVQKVAETALKKIDSFIHNKQIDKADELLAIQYNELRGRISQKKFSDKLSLANITIGIVVSAIMTAIAFGVTCSPLAPVALALMALTALVAIVVLFTKYYKRLQAEENLGIKEQKLCDQWVKKLNKIIEKQAINFGTLDKSKLNSIIENIKKGDLRLGFDNEFQIDDSMDKDLKKAYGEVSKVIKEVAEWSKERLSIHDKALKKLWLKELSKVKSSEIGDDGKKALELIKSQIYKKEFNPVVFNSLDTNNPNESLNRLKKVIASVQREFSPPSV